MDGRDRKFGSILEQVMANVESARIEEEKIQAMVEFYGKAIEGISPYEAIVKMAEEHKMSPEDVFTMLLEGGHVNVKTLDELKAAVKVTDDPPVDEAIGEPKAEKPKELPTKGGKDLGKLIPMGNAIESVDEKVTPKSLRVDAKAKDREATKLRREADKLEKKNMKAKDKAKKVGEGISPNPSGIQSSPDVDKLKEEDQIKTLTEGEVIEGLGKDVDALAAAAKKAMDAGNFEEALDLVSRLSQVQAALPEKLPKTPAVPKEEKEDKPPKEEPPMDETPPVDVEPPVEDLPGV